MQSIKKIILLFLFLVPLLFAQKTHPNLLLTKADAMKIRDSFNKYDLFEKSFNDARMMVDKALSNPIDVPYPKDAGGGYTHEKHKQNYNEMHIAGIMYQVTGDEKYAAFIKNMLDKYAEMYPGLKAHPEAKIESGGRLFWQTLNETVWLTHTIQAYDCIYDWLTPRDREKYERNIFLPMANFFLVDCEEEFDRIHNHGTWTVTAVGMTGLVLGKDDLVQKALYGSKLDKHGGFLPQLDQLFSPDGYYTEGGYYVRYALWPFFIFAEALANNITELKIYDYRDQIIKKAFYSALQMTYSNGAFMPINDALKEKTWLSPEIILGLNFVYERYGQDKQLLSLAKQHNRVTLTGAGLLVAKDFQETNVIPDFEWKSVQYTDGGDGKQGGVGIFRYGNKDDMQTLLFKYTSHGLSHGHYDKLHFLFYDQGEEIIQDYGAARFINIEQKFGGRYLPENKSYALQTVAHNTLVVDEKSHFNGKQEVSQKHHPEKYLYDASNPDFQYMSAVDKDAYPGVKMQRTMILVNDKNLYRPAVIDVFKVLAEKEHQYDLPFYYMGHFISASFDYKPFTTEKSILGKNNGYHHLWKEAEGKSKDGVVITWWNKNRFYSLINSADSTAQIIFTRIGGSDPNFNLRNEPGIMIRKNAKDYTFASVIEPHGEFDPTLEFTKDSYSTIEKVAVVYDNEDYTIVKISGKKGINWTLMISNKNADKNREHKVESDGVKYKWRGPIFIQK
jgi:hypothetical protein